MSKTSIVVGEVILLLVGTVIVQQVFLFRFKREKHQIVEQAAQIRDLQGQIQQLSNALQIAKNNASHSEEQFQELLRLRSEVAFLRQENQRLTKEAAADTHHLSDGPADPVSVLADRGTGTPEAAISTFLWVATLGDSNRVDSLLSVVKDETIPDDLAERLARAQVRSFLMTFSNLVDVEILAQETVSDGLSRMRLEFREGNGKRHLGEIHLIRDEEGWKPSINIERTASRTLQATFLLPLSPDLGDSDE